TTNIGSAVVTTTPVIGDYESKLGLTANGNTAAHAVMSDANGNWFLESTITLGNTAPATLTSNVEKIEALGLKVTGGNTVKVYMSVDPQKATNAAGVATFASVSLADYQLSDLTSGSTTDPLETLDTALAKVDT